MTQPKHTPLPWNVNGARIYDTQGWNIVKANPPKLKNKETRFAEHLEEQEANAAFIVRACNSFYQNQNEIDALNLYADEMKRQRDEMLEALKQIAELAKPKQEVNVHDAVEIIRQILWKAKPAIAKAEGGQS